MVDPRVGWVSEPTGRGTAGLLYNCLFTIFLCTWTAYHSDVPKPNWSWVKRFEQRFAYTILFICIPEAMILLAGKELICAMDIHDIAKRQLSVTKESDNDTTHMQFSLTHGFYFFRRGIVVETSDGVRRPLKCDSSSGNCDTAKLLVHGCAQLFTISKEEIMDKSKADTVTKTIAFIQTLWFAMQVIGRAVQHLPISTLEIFTISIIICSLTSYTMWWHKPKDVSTQVTVRVDITNATLQGILDAPGLAYSPGIDRAFNLVLSLVLFVGFLAAGTPLLAWNFSFPSQAEHIIWIVCTFISCILVLGFNLWAWIVVTVVDSDLPDSWIFWFVGLYIPFRLYFIVEAFAGLRSSPTGLYESVDWSLYIPHF